MLIGERRTEERGMNFTIGIDASRNRSGGAIAHLVGVLSALEPAELGIGLVHLWGYQALVDCIPDQPWLVKHVPIELEGSLPMQLLWQATRLEKELRAHGCDVLYSTDAATICRFRPMVVFSQDLLSYEPGALRQLGLGYASLRVLAILALQNLAFRRADGVIFLTRYAGKRIQASTGPLERVTFIPHGVSEDFRAERAMAPWPAGPGEPIRCVYVSPILGYKHQWNAVRAVEMLRRKGYDVSLTLVGDGDERATARLRRQIRRSDPAGQFVKTVGHIPPAGLPAFLAEFHLFLFVSSCEAFGITLLEGMSMGMPIVCSNESSLPETLRDAGVYCSPFVPSDIARALAAVIDDPSLRHRIAGRAMELSADYSWKHCANSTFQFIVNILSPNVRAD
jgi:glycosyltransferase involved in cell wall biosynthesis